MNTVAHGHGIRGGPERILRDVLARRRNGLPLRTVPRDLLEVSADGGSPRYGFIFGTGAIVAFLEAYYRRGRPSPPTAAAPRRARDRLRRRGRARSPPRSPGASRCASTTDGDEWPDAGYLAVAAGSTPDIGFGFMAFQRCGEQPGFFHAVGVTGSVGQLVLALPAAAPRRPVAPAARAGRGGPRARPRGRPPRFTIDGDLYAAERTVRVATGPGVEIVLP